MCLVQIEGRKGFPASCTTDVTEGMQVTTQGAALRKLRRQVLLENPAAFFGGVYARDSILPVLRERAADFLGIAETQALTLDATAGLTIGAATPCYQIYGNETVRRLYPALADVRMAGEGA